MAARIFLFFVLLLINSALLSEPIDPRVFNPLSETELKEAVSLLRASKLLGDGYYLQLLGVREPNKQMLFNKKPDQKLPRQALAVVVQPKKALAYECLIDLKQKKLLSKKEIKNGQPALMDVEFDLVDRLVKQNPQWQEAMRKRGIEDFNNVYVETWASGDLKHAKVNKNNRLCRSVFYYQGNAINPYSRPIEGISAIVDLSKQTVIIHDSEVVPLASRIGDIFTKETTKALPKKPPSKNIKLEGNLVSYGNWRFHASVQPREGLVIAALGYMENNKLRSILHRGSLSEMVVPYADTDDHWYWKAAFDEGEYSIGTMTTPLMVGVHAPVNALYLDALVATNDGTVVKIPHALAIYERDSGLLWSHFDSTTEKVAARAGKELVVLNMFAVGNYDYGIQWIFKEDGTIDVKVILTGILAAKGTNLNYCARCIDGTNFFTSPDRFGAIVDTNLMGVSHQHFFNFRLDFAIDGEKNQVAELEFKPIKQKRNNPHGNAYVLHKEIIASERDSGRDGNSEKGRRWLIYNPNIKNRLGHFPGFMLHPSADAIPFAKKKASSIKRAPFLKKSLWVTAYDEEERHAAGNYPNQGQGDGLPHWTKKRQASLLNQSLVVWYTLGISHLPSAEEWPVMPASIIGFSLKPMGFFDRNPTAPPEGHTLSAKGIN